MIRREFITLLGGAVAWPVAARAQHVERVRHVGVLLGWSESDPQFRSWFVVFVQELARLGWANGGNVRIEERWTNADIDRARPLAKELVELQPDVILVSTTPVTAGFNRKPARSPSCSRRLPILSGQGSSPDCPGQAAISRASSISRAPRGASGCR